MRVYRPCTLSTLLAAALLPTGARANAQSLRLRPESRLWVNGTSTVRSFQCSATSLDLSAATTIATPTRAVLAGEKPVTRAELTVPASRLDCGNGTMNKHMRNALKATQYPAIVFQLASYDLRAAGDSATGTITGALTLGGQTRTITIGTTATAGEDGTLRLTGATELRLGDYSLKPPSLFLGTLKVGNQVTVSFDFSLQDAAVDTATAGRPR